MQAGLQKAAAGTFPFSLACNRHNTPRGMAAAAIAAAAYALAVPLAPNLSLLVTSQLLAGVAWAGVITAAFARALASAAAAVPAPVPACCGRRSRWPRSGAWRE